MSVLSTLLQEPQRNTFLTVTLIHSKETHHYDTVYKDHKVSKCLKLRCSLGFIMYPTFLLPDAPCPSGQADVSAAEVRAMITCSHVPCVYLELRIRADWSTEKADVYHTWCRRIHLFIYPQKCEAFAYRWFSLAKTDEDHSSLATELPLGNTQAYSRKLGNQMA